MEKAKYGKMRQVNAVNGSQMVVKIGVAYYRRKQEHKVTSQKNRLFHEKRLILYCKYRKSSI